MANPTIRITAVDDATRTINRISASLEGLAAPIGALKNLGAAAGLGFIVQQLTNMVGAIDALAKASEGLGLTVVQLSELRMAASNAGVDTEKLEGALSKLGDKLEGAASGDKNAIRYFKDLGIAFKDAQGNVRPLMSVLEDLANVFARSNDGPGKLALALEGMGKGGRALIPYLNQGAAKLREFAGVTEESAKEAKQLQDEIDKLTNKFKAMVNAFAGWTAGKINKLFDTSIEKRIQELETIIQSMEAPGYPSNSQSAKNLENYKVELATLRTQLAMRDYRPDYAGKGEEPKKDLRQTNLAAIEALEALEREDKQWWDNYRKQLEAHRNKVEDANQRAKELFAQTDEAAKEEFRQASLAAKRTEDDQRAAREVARVENFNKKLQEQAEIIDQIGASLESAFSSLFSGGEIKLGNIFRALISDVTQFIYKLLILQPILEAIKRSLLPGYSGGTGTATSLLQELLAGGLTGKASGGPVSSGRGYLVGENGPEFFVPSMSGTIIPNGAMGVTIVQNVSVDARSDINSVRQAMAVAKNQAVYEVQQQMARRGALARA